MPKKRHWAQYSKPQTTAPQSLASSGLQSNIHHEEPQSRNVNDLLASLRRASLTPGVTATSRGSVASGSGSVGSAGAMLAAPASHTAAPSVPPEIAQILLPSAPGLGRGNAPQGAGGATPGIGPGGGAGVPGARRRAPAGPAPPPSWLSQSRHAPGHSLLAGSPSGRLEGSGAETRAYKGLQMPGVNAPDVGSLVNVVLRQISRDWDFQRHFNQYYLPYLQGPLKAALVSHLNRRGGERGGVSVADLRALFLPPKPEPLENGDGDGAADRGTASSEEDEALPECLNDDVLYLDLTGSAGWTISIRDVADLLFPLRTAGGSSVAAGKTGKSKGKQTAKITASELQESWDAGGSVSVPPALLPNLTHLSLALQPENGRAQEGASWRQLLSLAAHLPMLTHLSLAYWPEPTLTRNTKFATVVSQFGRVQYGGTGPYSHSVDNDWAEAILVVRKLSKALYGLEYLDLTGCGPWVPALTSRAEHDEVDWVGDWGKVTTLVLRHGHGLGSGSSGGTGWTTPVVRTTEQLPGEVARQLNAASEAQLVERHIRRQRAGRGRFITVVGDRPSG